MNVLIIEDDPMVDFIHRNYLEKTMRFKSIISSDSMRDAQEKMQDYDVDLILLDIHIKDGNGLQFLEYIRNKHVNCEVIIISAANDGKMIKSGFHFGVIDYLIKPFTFDRFEESIKLFIDRQRKLNQSALQQEQIDTLYNRPIQKSKEEALLEKGLSQSTYQLIVQTIDSIQKSFTIQDISEQSHLSHVSVRKYIAYLEDTHYIRSKQVYTKVGRPYRLFHKA